MKRQQLLVEPPAMATGDIAFNLIVFFLVCAAITPDSGRNQDMANSEEEQKKEESKNIEVQILPDAVRIDGDAVPMADVESRLRRQLENRTNPADKVVVVKSDAKTQYHQWILVTGWIEDAGGTITMQLEEEQVTIIE